MYIHLAKEADQKVSQHITILDKLIKIHIIRIYIRTYVGEHVSYTYARLYLA